MKSFILSGCYSVKLAFELHIFAKKYYHSPKTNPHKSPETGVSNSHTRPMSWHFADQFIFRHIIFMALFSGLLQRCDISAWKLLTLDYGLLTALVKTSSVYGFIKLQLRWLLCTSAMRQYEHSLDGGQMLTNCGRFSRFI